MAKYGKPERVTHVGATQADQAAGTQAGSQLHAFNVYPGMVIGIDPLTRKLNVTTDINCDIEDCVLMSDSLAAIMGFEQLGMPEIGTRIIVLYTPTQSYVLSGIAAAVDVPAVYSVPAGGYIDTCTLDDGALGVRRSETGKTVSGGGTPSRDLVPGEKEYSNNMGVWLRLLTNFAQMSAGELAKVEVGLINDMVRIVDSYFVHHNVGGDTMIWSGGRCNYESHFTGYPHEAEGKESENSKLAETKVDGIMDPEKSVESPASSTGRWRKSTYFGFLGDMIHTWVTDPTKVLSTYADGAARAGKYRCWVGADGQLMVQSVCGVHVEVSPYVIVPEVKYNWNDPEFDIEKAFNEFNKKFLLLWETANDDWADMTVSCWQMRDWAKYITHWHSLERWRGMEDSGYCKVEAGFASDPTCKEKDKADVNNDKVDKAYTGKAIFSMDPSGSISVISYGSDKYPGTSSVILNQGNVQIASSGNLELNCAGDLSITAKNISMKAINHVEISAIAGALWLKARTAWNALCEAGRMWLKSDRSDDSALTSDPYPTDGSQPEPGGDASLYGVYIDAAEGRVAVHGKKEVYVGTEDQGSNIYLNTKGADSGVCTRSTYTYTKVDKQSLIKAANFGVDAQATEITGGGVRMLKTLRVVPNTVDCVGTIRSEMLTANSAIMCNEMQLVAKPEEPEKIIPEVEGEGFDEVSEQLQNIANDPTLTTSDNSKELSTYVWRYIGWNASDGKANEWFTYKLAPYADGFENGDKDEASMKNLTKIKWENCGLVASKSGTTDTTSFPWPGKDGVTFIPTNKGPMVRKEDELYSYEKGNGGLKKMEKKPYTFYCQK